jgi:hypothetical protein
MLWIASLADIMHKLFSVIVCIGDTILQPARIYQSISDYPHPLKNFFEQISIGTSPASQGKIVHALSPSPGPQHLTLAQA